MRMSVKQTTINTWFDLGEIKDLNETYGSNSLLVYRGMVVPTWDRLSVGTARCLKKGKLKKF